jgi:hypothetical protein
MILEDALASFRRLLESSWGDISALEASSAQQGLTADWMQASWETVVEAGLSGEIGRIRLLVYGDGADCHPRSSRFSSPEDLPTHKVTCWPSDSFVVDLLTGRRLTDSGSAYIFDRFVSFKEGWYHEAPPFDHALLDAESEQYVVRVDRLRWDISGCDGGESGAAGKDK